MTVARPQRWWCKEDKTLVLGLSVDAHWHLITALGLVTLLGGHRSWFLKGSLALLISAPQPPRW